jgi:purine-binding chemotaxis protein CheW
MSTTAPVPAGIEPDPAPQISDDASGSLLGFAAAVQQKLDGAAAMFDDSELGIDDTRFDLEKYVLFFLQGQPYAFAIHSVIEIVRAQAITPVPHARAGVRGLINLRGRTLPIIDLAEWFELETDAKSSGRRIIIYQTEVEAVGFLVDDVAEVVGFGPEEIDAADASTDSIHSALVRGYARYKDYVVTLIERVEAAA